MKKTIAILTVLTLVFSCRNDQQKNESKASTIPPSVVTDKVPNDSDDPAIWIHPSDLSKSMILGTDKDENGGIYAFDLDGNILEDKTLKPVGRPNNIDVKQGLVAGDTTLDIAVFTERLTEKIRVVALPEMEYIDDGGIRVFEGEPNEDERACMGVAIFLDPENGECYAFVSRKYGPSGSYIWQYKLEYQDSFFNGSLVRKFGEFSGEGEIEAIAVDDELGYVYYSDEAKGIYKYYAHPDSGNTSLALFGENDFVEDREGIAIWPTTEEKGYLVISDQQDHSFEVYPREGTEGNIHLHKSLANLKLSTIETDGCEIYADSLSPSFPQGLFIAMSEGAVFHYYDLRILLDEIERK